MGTADKLAAALEAHEANLLALGRTMVEPRPDNWEPLLGERIAAVVDGLNVVREVRDGLAVELDLIEKALRIGAISHAGDGWFAADAGYGYDEADAAIAEGWAALTRLRAALVDAQLPARTARHASTASDR